VLLRSKISARRDRLSHPTNQGPRLAAAMQNRESRCKADTVLATVTRELEPHVATGPTGLGRRGESARPGSQEIACIVV